MTTEKRLEDENVKLKKLLKRCLPLIYKNKCVCLQGNFFYGAKSCEELYLKIKEALKE